MCRWLAYSGAPIHLDEVLFKTEHSLIDRLRRDIEAPSRSRNAYRCGRRDRP